MAWFLSQNNPFSFFVSFIRTHRGNWTVSFQPPLLDSLPTFPRFRRHPVSQRVTHYAFIALQKCHTDHCLKHFCELPSNISFPFLRLKTKPTQSETIALTLWIHRTEDELKLHFGLARYQEKVRAL